MKMFIAGIIGFSAGFIVAALACAKVIKDKLGDDAVRAFICDCDDDDCEDCCCCCPDEVTESMFDNNEAPNATCHRGKV